MGFIPETCPPYCGHSRFDRLERDAVLHFARSSAFPPGQASYDEPPNEMRWTTKHLIRGRSGSPHLWDAAVVIRFTSTWLIVVDGFLALACLSFPMLDAEARENRKNRFFCLLIWLADFPADRYYASGRWSAPLLNDLSLASPGVCLPREIAIHTVRHRKPTSTCCSPFWFRGALSFRHKRS